MRARADRWGKRVRWGVRAGARVCLPAHSLIHAPPPLLAPVWAPAAHSCRARVYLLCRVGVWRRYAACKRTLLLALPSLLCCPAPPRTFTPLLRVQAGTRAAARLLPDLLSRLFPPCVNGALQEALSLDLPRGSSP